MNKDIKISETDLLRTMLDQAARAQHASKLHARQLSMQAVLAKVQSLSDDEFDMAIETLDSLLKNFTSKKEINKKKSQPNPGQELGLTQSGS